MIDPVAALSICISCLGFELGKERELFCQLCYIIHCNILHTVYTEFTNNMISRPIAGLKIYMLLNKNI